jgi:hypothetical protein
MGLGDPFGFESLQEGRASQRKLASLSFDAAAHRPRCGEAFPQSVGRQSGCLTPGPTDYLGAHARRYCFTLNFRHATGGSLHSHKVPIPEQDDN